MGSSRSAPVVSGRDQNRAMAAARHAQAVQMATEGLTYQATADGGRAERAQHYVATGLLDALHELPDPDIRALGTADSHNP